MVVVLPEPVGPVMSTKPWGSAASVSAMSGQPELFEASGWRPG